MWRYIRRAGCTARPGRHDTVITILYAQETKLPVVFVNRLFDDKVSPATGTVNYEPRHRPGITSERDSLSHGPFKCRGRDSSVRIAASYGLVGPGSNASEGEIFRTCPDRPSSPPTLLYNGYRVFPGGKERPGREADPSPPSSSVGHERVELYLYSPYGPYGLYRASVPVQG